MRLLFIALLASLSAVVCAQNDSSADWRVFRKSKEVKRIVTLKDTLRHTPVKRAPGKVTINEASRITELADKYDRMEHVQKGYRVQIYLGDRDGQGEARKKFTNLYPDYSTYPDYQAPNFKVRVGDFKRRSDAERLLYEIRKEFPGAYIVPDEVELLRIP